MESNASYESGIARKKRLRDAAIAEGYVVSALQQKSGDGGADYTGAAGDQNSHFRELLSPDGNLKFRES